jgi:parallel beta-helix repeat protein
VGTEEHQPEDPDFIQLIRRTFEPDCSLLLCSDGLSDLVTSAQILSVAQRHVDDPTEIVQQLIKAANMAGGKDNITVLFIAHEQNSPRSIETSIASHDSDLQPRSSDLNTDFDESLHKEDKQYSTADKSRIFLNHWLFLVYGSILTAAFFLLLGQSKQKPLGPLEVNSVRQSRTLVVNAQDPSAFKTINDALDQAGQGDIIEVAPGRYIEFIRLRDDVTLISKELRQAVIQTPNSTNSSERVAVLASGIRKGRFIGFRLEGDNAYPLDVGLRLLGADVEVSDVEVTGTRKNSIDIGGAATNCVLRANLIQDNDGVGILIRDEAAPRLIHNIIVRNGQRTDNYGLRISGNARPQLIGNTIADNGIAGINGLSPTQEEETIRQNNLFGVPSVRKVKKP